MGIARVLPFMLAAGLAAVGALAQPGADGRQGPNLPPSGLQAPMRRPIAPHGAGGRMSYEERQRLREDLRATERDLHQDRGAQRSGEEERRHEYERLRESMRSGQIDREEAIRRYRERFGDTRPPQAAQQEAAKQPEQAPATEPHGGAIERLREAVREGRMSPREARERLREERMRRAAGAGRLTPEERDQLRRDILEANRNLQRR